MSAGIETRIRVTLLEGAGGQRVLRLSTHGYAAGADEGRVDYLPDIEALPSISRSLGLGLDYETVRTDYSAIQLANRAGQYDWLRGCAFGRAIEILEGPVGAPTSVFATVMTGTLDRADVGWATADLIVRDRLALLRDRPITAQKFAGTSTSGGLGAEGGAALTDRPWPTGWGIAEAVTPVEANAADHLYHIGVYQSVSGAHDGGVPLTVLPAQHATLAALMAATLTTGQVAQAPTLGLVRLGAAPTAALTVSAQWSAVPSAGALARAILTGPGGLTAAEIDPSIDALPAWPCGWWTGADETGLGDVLDGILSAIDAHWYDLPTGQIAAIRLTPPELVAAGTKLTADDVLDGADLASAGTEVPSGRVEVEYRRAWTTLAADSLAQADTAERQAYRDLVSREYRLSAIDRPAVVARWPNHQTARRQTTLAQAADAATLAGLLADLYERPRRAWSLGITRRAAIGLDIGRVVDLSALPRLGLGRAWVTAIARTAASAKITVWG